MNWDESATSLLSHLSLFTLEWFARAQARVASEKKRKADELKARFEAKQAAKRVNKAQPLFLSLSLFSRARPSVLFFFVLTAVCGRGAGGERRRPPAPLRAGPHGAHDPRRIWKGSFGGSWYHRVILTAHPTPQSSFRSRA